MSHKMSLLLVVLLFSLAFPITSQASLWGCNIAKPLPGKTKTGCLMVNNKKRNYNIHIPNTYQKINSKVALVIGLHGGGGKPEQLENYSQLSVFSNKYKNFIVVYPQGIDKHWNDGRPDINTGIDDVKFLKQLVTHIKNELSLPIDLKKVFVIGMSNGGLMSMRLACEQVDWLAGVGVVAASMSTQIASTCNAKASPLPTIFIFGDKDTSFLSNGKQVNPVRPSQQRGTHIGILHTVKVWADINQCTDEIVSIKINNNSDDKTTVTRTSYTGCTEPVIFYDIKNGGHRWPNVDSRNGYFIVKALNLGLASHSINATEEILKAFVNNK